MPYKHIPDLEVPEAVAIPECDRCQQRFIGGPVVSALDEALRERYMRALLDKADGALTELRPFTTQRELEGLLGLSGGYLSKIKGETSTSSVLVAALMLLAQDPGRLHELRALWSVGAGPKRAERTRSSR